MVENAGRSEAESGGGRNALEIQAHAMPIVKRIS